MLFSRSILKDEGGAINGYMYFLSDLTELKATQEELKRAEHLYRSMYQNAVQAMFQSKLSGELIRVNPSYANILGYGSPEELLELKESADKMYFNPEDRTRMIRAVKKKGALVNYELRLKRKDGKPIWVLANIRLINDDQGNPILEGILVDNTKRKALEKELRRDRQKFRNLANHDNLTGLFNTRYLYNTLDKLIENRSFANQEFGLIFMDMDNFKLVVDTYGHLNGSQALKEVAQTIIRSTKSRNLTFPSFDLIGAVSFLMVTLFSSGSYRTGTPRISNPIFFALPISISALISKRSPLIFDNIF